MITVEEFDKVQQRVRGEVPKDRYSKHAFPYKGLILCAKCGRPLTAERQKGRHKRGDWVYYHCNNASGFCGKTSIREDVLEKRLNECLEAITITPDFRDVVMDALEKWTTTEFRGLESVYEQQTRSLSENERLQNELLEMRMRQLIDDETFRRKQAQLREEFVGLKGKTGNIEERLELTRKTVEHAMEFRLKAREEFMTGDLNRRRAIARTLGVRYLYQDGKVFIEMHPLLMYQAKPMKDVIEPLEIGYENKKDGKLLPSVPLGWADGTLIEPLCLNQIFRSVMGC